MTDFHTVLASLPKAELHRAHGIRILVDASDWAARRPRFVRRSPLRIPEPSARPR